MKTIVDLENDLVKPYIDKEITTRATLGAHNLFETNLALIKALNTGGTWSGNTYSRYDVDFTVNEDLSITVTTTGASDTAVLVLDNNTKSLDVPMVLSGCPSGGSSTKYKLSLFKSGETSIDDFGDGIDVPANTNGYELRIAVYTGAGNIGTKTFYPMIRLATDTDTTYRPYVPTNSQLLSYRDNGVLGAKNLLPNSIQTQVAHGVTITRNADGSLTFEKTGTVSSATLYLFQDSSNPIKLTSPCKLTSGAVNINTALIASVDGTDYTCGNSTEEVLLPPGNMTRVRFYFNSDFTGTLTLKPMIRLVTDSDTTYQPYAMTNKELTDKSIKYVDVTDTTNAYGRIEYSLSSGVPISAIVLSANYKYVVIATYDGVPKLFYIKDGNDNSVLANTQVTLRIYYIE